MSTRSILKQLLDSFFLKLRFMYSFSVVVIENLYIQTSLMVALSLFRVKEGGAHVYKSEVDTMTQSRTQQDETSKMPMRA